MKRISKAGRQAAQSLVEFAITAPAVLSMLLGGFDLSAYISDLQVAVASVREGARVASVLGGQTCAVAPLSPAYPDPSYVDAAIVQNVLTITRQLNFATVNRIYIYAPQAASGVFNGGTDYYSKYTGAGVFQSSNFALDKRLQLVPNETSIGVELDWTYNPPTLVGTATLANLSHFAVFKAMAVPSGC
jgi:hypothetical protein